MKSKINKAIATIMAIALSASMSLPVFAAENPTNVGNDVSADETVFVEVNDNTNNGDNSIAPAAYYDWTKFSYKGRYTCAQKWFDGGHMAVEICATSDTPGLTMQVTAHIIGDRSVTRNVPVDGNTYKWDWLSLGTSSGRNVILEYSCVQNTNATINVHHKSYSW